MARDNNNRVTPSVVQNYNIEPAARVVDKQSKYTPQLGDAAKLKHTAQGLADLAKGVADTNSVLMMKANENAIEATAKTEEKNRNDWAEVSKNINGMAKFNPYNKEAYKGLRAKAKMEEGIYELAKLEAYGDDLTYEEFEAQRQQIINQTVQNMGAEGLKAKHTSGYLTKLQNQSFALKDKYITKKAEQDYQVLQNQMVSSTSKDIATLTYLNPNGYIEGWNEAVKNLTDVANGVGMDNTKQAELFYKTVNQYLVDNVDDIDAEEFMVALGQTKINGTPLSDYDPNYATTMKQMLIKAKGAKYELDKTDLAIEKLRLERATLAANSEIFAFMADPTKTQAEKKQKAIEIIEANGMEAIGFDFLNKIANDNKTLLELETTQTNPQTYEALMRKHITGELSQTDILEAIDNKQLGVREASSLFNAMKSDDKREVKELQTYLTKRYLADNPEVELGIDTESGKSNKEIISKAVYDAVSDQTISKAEQQRRLAAIQKVAKHMEETHNKNTSSDPSKLLTSAYMSTQKNRIKVQDMQETQRALAKMGMLKNQANWNDSNIKVSSVMQKDRTVTLSDGTTVNRPHYGTDISTYTGRQIYTPYTGKVVASGHNASMGNYILFERADGKGFIKLMHLQAAELPRAGTTLLKGKPMAHVGNTGAVEDGAGGVLHIECFDNRMRLVDPVQFITGKTK